MNEQDTLLAQGTKLRIAATLAVVVAATTVLAGVVTVPSVAHGLDTGDRISVAGTGYPVTVVDADNFTYENATAVDAATVSYRPLLDIAPKTFSGPGGSASVIDATTLSSTAKRKRMGLKDNGQLGFTVLFKNSNKAHAALRAARDARALTPIELEFEDGVIWLIYGFVLQFALSGSVDGLVEAAVSVEIDGEITELA